MFQRINASRHRTGHSWSRCSDGVWPVLRSVGRRRSRHADMACAQVAPPTSNLGKYSQKCSNDGHALRMHSISVFERHVCRPPTCDPDVFGVRADRQAVLAGGAVPELEQARPGGRGQRAAVRREGARCDGPPVAEHAALVAQLPRRRHAVRAKRRTDSRSWGTWGYPGKLRV